MDRGLRGNLHAQQVYHWAARGPDFSERVQIRTPTDASQSRPHSPVSATISHPYARHDTSTIFSSHPIWVTINEMPILGMVWLERSVPLPVCRLITTHNFLQSGFSSHRPFDRILYYHFHPSKSCQLRHEPSALIRLKRSRLPGTVQRTSLGPIHLCALRPVAPIALWVRHCASVHSSSSTPMKWLIPDGVNRL